MAHVIDGLVDAAVHDLLLEGAEEGNHPARTTGRVGPGLLCGVGE
jgi:hypothetical protein